jgi:hypothetical protein
MKVHMVVFQLKGSALLWWKMLLPQLNMVVEDLSWELFEEWFRERYLSKEFIKHQLKRMPSGWSSPSTRPVLWSCFGMLSY